MKHYSFVIVLLFASMLKVSAQQVGVKTNFMYWATTTPNIGLEFKTSEKTSLSLVVANNPFLFRSKINDQGDKINPKLKHWLVMPEFKYWFCKAFERTNIGIHAIYADYNVGGISFISKLKDHRYKGYLYGGGVSVGYQWAVGKRMGLELSVGAGYIYTKYSKYECHQCGELLGENSKNYFGPTKAALSLIYYIN